jgi:hypothetical protein
MFTDVSADDTSTASIFKVNERSKKTTSKSKYSPEDYTTINSSKQPTKAQFAGSLLGLFFDLDNGVSMSR